MPIPELTAIEGVRALEAPDEETVLRRYIADYRFIAEHAARRNGQVIEFDSGPVGLALFSDLHLGAPGVDIERMLAEIKLAVDAPGMYIGFLGDLVDNMIVGRLLSLQMYNRATISDQYVLLRLVLRLAGPKLLFNVGGNHDAWTESVAGIDYFREVVAGIRPDTLYASDDARITFRVGGVDFPARFRHKWRGKSILNPTHGIERGWRYDKDFRLGVGAHNHDGSVSRTFNAGGEQGLAVQLGSYKVEDKYARAHGLPKPPSTAAAAVILDPETGSMTGFDNLMMAARVLGAFYE